MRLDVGQHPYRDTGSLAAGPRRALEPLGGACPWHHPRRDGAAYARASAAAEGARSAYRESVWMPILSEPLPGEDAPDEAALQFAAAVVHAHHRKDAIPGRPERACQAPAVRFVLTSLP